MHRTFLLMSAIAAILLLGIMLFLRPAWEKDRSRLSLASKRFTESYILGEIYKQVAIEQNEAPIDYHQGLGNTGIVFNALQEGLVDAYPEYTGTIASEILKRPELSDTPEMLNDHLRPLGLEISESLGFQDNYALAMLEEQAEKLRIYKISDLAKHPQLILGFSPEFIGRKDGWAGLKTSNYSFPQNDIKTIDHSLSYEALQQRKIDVSDTYTTDPKIQKYNLRILEDDLHFFPIYSGVLLYRKDSAKLFPKTWKAFQQLNERISTQEMIRLNAEAELDGKSFSTIARDYLQQKKPATVDQQPSPLFLRLIAPDLWVLTKQHLFLVFGALIPAIIAGMLLGILAMYVPLLRHLILNSVGIIQTIPSLALLAFLIPLFREIGTVPALVALFLYSLLPIVRNTFAGLSNIPASLQDAAAAMGLPLLYRLVYIEIPLASRTILAGIKTAAVLNVGMATIAAFIGAGGYGDLIVAGLGLNNYEMLLSGAIPACLLAIAIQVAFDRLDCVLIPKGLKLE